jgi:ribonuclease HI
MKRVSIYTDGACSGNPGPGGWACILSYNDKEQERSGHEDHTTNNRMELMAAIEGLTALKESCQVCLYSDSAYLINGMSKGWAKSWQKKGWIKSDKKPALNPDLWERLLELNATHSIDWIWVKGHESNTYNNRCDELAVKRSKERRKEESP